VSKHPKFCSKTRTLCFPFRGQKNPSAEHHSLLGVSDSSFRGTNFISFAPIVKQAFQPAPSHFTASRTADESISNKVSCKSFFNYFLTPENNHRKAHEIRLIPIPAQSIRLHPNPNNVQARAKKLSALLHENVSHSFPRRPKCFPKIK
jgi:hypothetical protein